MRPTARAAAVLRAWAAAERGLAFVEFALILPVVLLLVLGGIELSNYVLACLRVQQIAQTVADNAGRVRHAMDETDVNEVMIGGKLMGKSIDFAANGRIILSDLEQRTTGGITVNGVTTYKQWIRWQRCAGALAKASSYGTPIDATGAAVTNLDSTTNADHGAAQGASTIAGMGPSSGQIAASASTAVMVVEVFYTYQPLIRVYQRGDTVLHAIQAFNIRQRSDFSIYNANALTGTRRSDCLLNDATVPTG